MNPFTTEHPLNSQPSWFDAKTHPGRALVGRGLALALALTPVVLVGLYFWAFELEDGNTTPEPLTAAGLGKFLLVGGAFSFMGSAVAAFLVVAGWWLARRPWRRGGTSSC